MTIDLTPAELREFAKSEGLASFELNDMQNKVWSRLCSHDARFSLALALADATERVEQLTNEARLANNAVGSHANEIVMLSAKINDLKTVLKRAYNAMAEPHGDWKDIREAKSLIEIRAMLGGEPT